MRSSFWPIVFTLLWLLGCGDKTEVKVSDAQPAASAKDPGKPVTGDWLLYTLSAEPEQLNPLTASDGYARDVTGDNIFKSLLTRDSKNLELKPYLTDQPPTIS